MAYDLVIQDNLHSQSPAHETEGGTFASADDAVREAKSVIDISLRACQTDSDTAAMLFERWRGFGARPMIFGPDRPAFKALEYTRSRAGEIVNP